MKTLKELGLSRYMYNDNILYEQINMQAVRVYVSKNYGYYKLIDDNNNQKQIGVNQLYYLVTRSENMKHAYANGAITIPTQRNKTRIHINI